MKLFKISNQSETESIYIFKYLVLLQYLEILLKRNKTTTETKIQIIKKRKIFFFSNPIASLINLLIRVFNCFFFLISKKKLSSLKYKKRIKFNYFLSNLINISSIIITIKIIIKLFSLFLCLSLAINSFMLLLKYFVVVHAK